MHTYKHSHFLSISSEHCSAGIAVIVNYFAAAAAAAVIDNDTDFRLFLFDDRHSPAFLRVSSERKDTPEDTAQQRQNRKR